MVRDETSAKKVAAYMSGLKRFRNAVPVRVKLVKGPREFVFVGARSDQVDTYTAVEKMVAEGRAKAGEEYTRPRFDLLGVRPELLCRTTRGAGGLPEQLHVFRIVGDATEADWYVSSFYESPASQPWHPFGPWFSVHRWNHELPWHGRIDGYEDRKRVRLEMHVEVLT